MKLFSTGPEVKKEVQKCNSFELVTRQNRIQSVSLQTNQEGNIQGSSSGSFYGFILGISGGVNGSFKGNVKLNPYYYTFVTHEGKGYLLEKFKAEEVFIQEIDGEPYIEEKTHFVLIDTTDFIYDDTVVYIDSKVFKYNLNYNEFCNYEDIDTKNYVKVPEGVIRCLSKESIEKLEELGLGKHKELYSSTKETTIYIPKGSIIQEFNMSI